MASPFRIGVAFSLLLLLAADSPGGTAPTAQEIAKAVDQLGSSNFRLRQKASAFLWAAGKAAEPALQRALKSEDKEVVRRAREILDKFNYGIYPTTPKRVVELIKEYRSGSEESKRIVMQELNKQGSPGHTVLIKLAGREKDAQLRRELFDLLTGDVVPGLLADSRFDEVEELLEMGIKSGDEQALRNYAAFLFLRGQLDAKIPAWAAKAKKLTGYRAAEVLMYMYRTKGDLKNATLAARKTDKKHLLASMLIEQGDWKELAANPESPEENADPLEKLGYTAAYHRLAGNTKDFENAIADIKKEDTKNNFASRQVAILLLLNNRPREAIDLLVKRNSDPTYVFDLLSAQHRFPEAFDSAAKADRNPDPRRGRTLVEAPMKLDLAVARTHVLLGQKDQARKILAKVFHDAKNPKDCSGQIKVIETEVQLQLTEDAFAHCAEIIAQAEKEGQETTLLGHLFPEKGARAKVWWKFFRQKRLKEKHADRLKRLRQVFDGKVPAKEFAGLAQEVEKAAADPDREDERGPWLQALGETCLVYDRQDLAQNYLDKAGTPDALIRLGDLLAGKKLWQQAAQRYRQAWTKDKGKPLPLYLHGRALTKSGLEEEGRKWMDLAQLLPLAQDGVRFKFSQALADRGLAEEAQRKRELIVRTGKLNFVEVSNALRFLGLEAYKKKDFELAAAYHERTLLVCLGRIAFIKANAYLTAPASVHHLRAQALLARGKIDEALKEAELCLAGLPGEIESVINLVPELEKRSRKKQAEDLFRRAFDHYAKVCKAYPKSAQFHNSLAWVSVCCRRQLDKALEHSRQAVALSPDSAGCLDTLAEVYYQRGDKTQALKLMKKCIELDPKSDYFKKQVKRFEASGPPSETPR